MMRVAAVAVELKNLDDLKILEAMAEELEEEWFSCFWVKVHPLR